LYGAPGKDRKRDRENLYHYRTDELKEFLIRKHVRSPSKILILVHLSRLDNVQVVV